MTSLETRKKLLLVESELNRAQLRNELRDLKNGLHDLTEQIHAIGSVAASAAKLATTVSAIGNAFTHHDAKEKKKSSWISSLFKVARTGASIWVALRANQK